MVDLFKDIIPSILQTKKDLSEDDGFTKTYTPFIVNRAISFHYDCILPVNEMNRYPNLPKVMQYQFLLNTVRGYKRPYKQWQKRETISDLEIIKEYYNYSDEKAKDVMVLLTADQIEQLRKRIDKGGSKNDNKHSRPKRLHRG
jgi:hypothetical protein